MIEMIKKITKRPTKIDVLSGRIATLKNLLNVASNVTDPVMQLDQMIAQLECVTYVPFPLSMSTVDILPYYKDFEGNVMVILGRKPRQTKFQLIGGFREPKQSSEEAALRELFEESCIAGELCNLKYITSLYIDDRRYKDTVHKITTSAFIVEITEEEFNNSVELAKINGTDDIEEIKSFLITDVINETIENVRDLHINLAKYLAERIFIL